jgi:outer membrane protein OmpA-like peptidoglycan-associated protein
VKLNTVDARVRSFPAETLASKTWRPGCIGVAVSPTTIGLGINEEAAMRQAVMVGVVLPAALMLVSGCATKKWVTEFVGKKEVEIDQRFTGVDKKMSDESQRVDQRVEGVDTRLKSTEGTLTQTKERAESAYSKADDTNSRLTRLWSNRNVRNQVENYQVLFGFDKWDLNDNAQTTLVSIIKEMKENPNLTVDLQGYADPVGSYPYNVGLSQRRVESVRRFLVEKGIELPRIHLIGLGPIAEKGTPNAEKRKVTVKLLVTKED